MKGPLLLAIVGTAALAFHVPSSVAVRKKSRVVSCRAVHHPTLSPAALGVATGAVARLVTVCGLGATYAKLGVLDAAACATLSRLIYFIFQPAMLFVNCAGTISSTTGAWRLAALPAFAATQIGLGLMFGWAALLREKNRNSVEARELRALCAFGNAGPLPFVFAEGFFRSQPELLARAVAYISFYLVGWSPLFWTLGPMILEGSTKVSLKKIASPPVLASVFGVLVGSQASVAHFLFQGPARPLLDSLRLLGQAYLPCVALVLAGTLARSLDSSPKQSDDDFDKSTIPLRKRLALLSLCRFVWLPFASFMILQLATANGLLPGDDKLMRFVLLMASAMPSAQNAIVILQLQKPVPGESNKAAPSMAKTLSLLYLLAVLPMALLLSAATDFTGVIE